MGVASTILGIGAGLLGSYGTYKSGEARNDYYQYLATENEAQAQEVIKTAKTQQGLIYNAAARTTEQVRENLDIISAKQKTALASNNIALSSGTAEDIARSSFAQENKDEMAIRYNANLSAWDTLKSAEQSKLNLLSQAKGYRLAGKSEKKASGLNIFSSLLGTASEFIG